MVKSNDSRSDRLSARHRVVVVGGGFGGLETVKGLAGAGVDITLIDRRNHHIFQPLLYQVATASLATSDVAWPLRYIFRDRKDVSTILGAVTGVDAAARTVRLEDGSEIPYDSLVLATGARHAYFGNDEWELYALGLKTIEDATTIRRHILLAFERAERESDPAEKRRAPDLRNHRCGPNGSRAGGDNRRTGARHPSRRLSKHRYASGQNLSHRSRATHIARLSR